jgi:uncharacterized protein YecE (DUF72 family)
MEKSNNKKFLVHIKSSKKITHEKTTQLDSDYLDYFLTNITHLGSKLGPVQFQFPPSFKSDSINFLKDLVSVLHKQHRYSLEVRNKSWCDDQFYIFLNENTVALVLGDSPWLQGIEKITANFAYFRFEGNRKQVKGTSGIVEKERSGDIKKWADKIQSLPDDMEVFGYFSKYYSGHSQTDAQQLLAYLVGN